MATRLKPENPSPSPWSYASVGLQLAVTLGFGFYAGYRLDEWKKTFPWFTLAGALFGILIGLYNFLIRFLRK